MPAAPCVVGALALMTQPPAHHTGAALQFAGVGAILMFMIPTARIATLAVLTISLLTPAAVMAQVDEAPAPPADGEVVRVVNVIDGDTIRVEREDGEIERVRYIGIDTPEMTGEESDSEPEPYSRQASLANAGYVEDQSVVLETDVSDRDRFDRLLRYVWVETEDGWVMVNERLVALGLADVKTYEPDTKYQSDLLDSQASAVLTGRGMHDAAAVARQLIGAEAMAYLFFDAYDARDASTLRRLLSSDVVYRLPGNEKYRGKKKVMSKFRKEWAQNDPMVTIRSSIAQPDSAVLEVTIVTTGEQSAEPVDAAPEPADATLESIDDTEPIDTDEPIDDAAAEVVDEPIDANEVVDAAEPIDAAEPVEVVEASPLAAPGEVADPVVGLEAVAVQRWPDDKLVDYRIYRDE
jgi:micrococcal nuclease